MPKRTLTPEYRTGAEAFAALYRTWCREALFDVDAARFTRIVADMGRALSGQSPEFEVGFREAVALLLEDAISTAALAKLIPSDDWLPMRDLEHPGWWLEDEPEGEGHDQA